MKALANNLIIDETEAICDWTDRGAQTLNPFLAGGSSGLLLLFSSLQKHGLWGRADEYIYKYIIEIKHALEQVQTLNLSLYEGACGVAFAVHHSLERNSKYTPLFDSLHEYILSYVQSSYLSKFEELQAKKALIPIAIYDVVFGVCGLGRYLLKMREHSKSMEVLHKMLTLVVNWAKPTERNGHEAPGWLVSKDDVFNQKHSHLYPNGNFNTGLAHGISGVLAFLSTAYLQGVDVQGLVETISYITHWLHKCSFTHEESQVWPYVISWDEETHHQLTSPQKARDAWCYGVPGTAYSLLLAAKALKCSATKTFAIDAFKGVFRRRRSSWELPGPCLCHGVSGLLMMTLAFNQIHPSNFFNKKAHDLIKILMSDFNPDEPLGFQDVRDGKRHNSVGFLEGSAGVLLAILTQQTNDFSWALPLMIYE